MNAILEGKLESIPPGPGGILSNLPSRIAFIGSTKSRPAHRKPLLCITREGEIYCFTQVCTTPLRSTSQPGHVRVSMNIETPGLVLILAGIVHTDARGRRDPTNSQVAILDPQLPAGQVLTVELLVDRHR